MSAVLGPGELTSSRRQNRRAAMSRVFAAATFACTMVGILALAILVYQVLSDGLTRVNPAFLVDLPSRFADKAGF